MYVHVTLNDYYKHIIYDIAMQYIRYRSNTYNVTLTRHIFARRMLALYIYHLESSSLQLKNHSTLGLLYN